MIFIPINTFSILSIESLRLLYSFSSADKSNMDFSFVTSSSQRSGTI
jgi:hypothetical protein